MLVAADQMTSRDAARRLGITVRQVQRLAETRELVETGRIGGNIMLDAGSVHRLAERGSQRGRPWSESTSWAAIELLDSGRTARLNAAQRSRLRARLRQIDAEQFVRLARRHAETVRYRASSSLLDGLRAQVTTTGSAAMACDRRIADEFGLATGNQDSVEGYLPRWLLDAYRDEFFLVEDQQGNVTLRAIDDDTRARSVASITAIALDLTDSLDTRARSAGLQLLNEKLHEA